MIFLESCRVFLWVSKPTVQNYHLQCFDRLGGIVPSGALSHYLAGLNVQGMQAKLIGMQIDRRS